MTPQAKILVVDDDVDIHRLLTVKLRKAGYEVITTTDGVGCMQQARREKPDLIVLDLGIPGGDGFTSLQRLRASGSFAAIPVVVLTGNDAAGVEERTRNLGASAFVAKEDGTDVLVAAIDRLLLGDDEGGASETDVGSAATG